MLLSFLCSAFSITPRCRPGDIKILRSCRELQIKKTFVAEVNSSRGNLWLHTEHLNNRRSNRPGQRRRHGVTYLPRTVPFCGMEAKPIGKAVKTCHFADRNTPRMFIVDGTRACKSATRAIRASTKSIGQPFGRKLKKSTNRFDGTGHGMREAPARDVSMYRPRARSQQDRVPIARDSEVPRVVRKRSHF